VCTTQPLTNSTTTGVLLLPAHPTTAPVHNLPIFRVTNTCYTSFFNAMQLPVTSVPFGRDRRGLPIGLQVVGGWGCDHVTIAVALALERLGGGVVRPWDWPPEGE